MLLSGKPSDPKAFGEIVKEFVKEREPYLACLRLVIESEVEEEDENEEEDDAKEQQILEQANLLKHLKRHAWRLSNEVCALSFSFVHNLVNFRDSVRLRGNRFLSLTR